MAGKGYGALPYAKVLRRSTLLLILGLLLNGFPTFDLASLRLTGVLQRIAICYLFAALVFLHARLVTQICLIVGMLTLYHVLMVVVPVPGCGAGSLTRECNLAGHIDRLLLGQRLPVGSHDPEGLLSTLPSLATTLLGSLAGQMLRSAQPQSSKVVLLSAAGLAGVLAALAWHQVFPVNKNLMEPFFRASDGGGEFAHRCDPVCLSSEFLFCAGRHRFAFLERTRLLPMSSLKREVGCWP